MKPKKPPIATTLFLVGFMLISAGLEAFEYHKWMWSGCMLVGCVAVPLFGEYCARNPGFVRRWGMWIVLVLFVPAFGMLAYLAIGGMARFGPKALSGIEQIGTYGLNPSTSDIGAMIACALSVIALCACIAILAWFIPTAVRQALAASRNGQQRTG